MMTNQVTVGKPPESKNGSPAEFAMEERIDGVRVLRRWVFATPNSGFFKRILNWMSFALTSLTASRRVGPVDVIFVQSPPLPIGIATLAYAWLASRVGRVRLLLRQEQIRLFRLFNHSRAGNDQRVLQMADGDPRVDV